MRYLSPHTSAAGKLLPYTHLSYHGSHPDTQEDGVLEQTREDVSLSVYFTRVHLIKECHHDKHVEYDGEVLRGRVVQTRAPTIINLKENLA